LSDVLECGTEADEGWETVHRTNKAKYRPSPTAGALSKAGVPARQADDDRRRTVSQLRRREGNYRAKVAVSRQTEAKNKQCSVSAVDVSGINRSNFTKSSLVNAAQQSKSSSHIARQLARSSPRVMQLPVTVCNSETVKSDTCLKMADIPAADTAGDTESKSDETSMRGSGDRRLIVGDTEAGLCDTLTRGKQSVGNSDVSVTHGVSRRTCSSMTEVHCSDSTDIQQSSADSDRPSFHLCRTSVSDDTLVEHMTVSGTHLVVNNNNNNSNNNNNNT